MPRNQSAQELGLAIGTVVKVEMMGRVYKATTTDGADVTDKFQSYALKNAFRKRQALLLTETKTGGTAWRQVSPVEFDKVQRGEAVAAIDLSAINIGGQQDYMDADRFPTHADLVSFIQSSYSLKPKKLKIDETSWKFCVRAVLRGGNLLVTGPSGCGKTLLANALKVALGLEDKFFFVGLGAAQDPRSTLVGNTHFDPTRGTFVALSEFMEGIQIPGALILLDEISRASSDASNILITPLDQSQRYVRVDEMADHPTIEVAPGVTFILTANIGTEYTGTHIIDRALLDRCDIYEMQPLGLEDEIINLTEMFPDLDSASIKAVAEVACSTRDEIHSETPKVTTIISTRMAEKWAANVYDGLTFMEAADKCVIPFFDPSGGPASERAHMIREIQAHAPNAFSWKSQPFKSDDDIDPNMGKQKPF